MSRSILYHCFGVIGRGIHHVNTRFEGGRTVFRINQDPSTFRCTRCGERSVQKKGTVRRVWMTLPIGLRRTLIEWNVQRLRCLVCGALRQVKIPFADPGQHYTRAFERYVVDLCRLMTMQDVARLLNISWHTVKAIHKKDLKKRFSNPSLKSLKRIAIDEISIGRMHRYLTVVLDLQSGAVVFVGDGKGAEALEPFWKRLKRSKARIEAVAMDMSIAYISAVTRNLPRATIVFDHFHVIKLMNEKLTDLRRELHREATDVLEKEVLKGTRWLLVKNQENLNSKYNEHERLDEALRLNRPLTTAYYLKEHLGLLWKQDDRSDAAAHLDDWIATAQASGIRILIEFANTLSSHRTGILAFYDFPISTGPLEGTNNKIKTLQRRSYGFRDKEFFILKIHALHQTRLELIG